MAEGKLPRSGSAAALRTAIVSVPNVRRRRFREVPEAYSVQ